MTAALIDIPSESRKEARIADEVEAALRAQASGFEIIRNGNAVLARTKLNRSSRVLLAGHLTPCQWPATCLAAARTTSCTAAAQPT